MLKRRNPPANKPTRVPERVRAGRNSSSGQVKGWGKVAQGPAKNGRTGLAYRPSEGHQRQLADGTRRMSVLQELILPNN